MDVYFILGLKSNTTIIYFFAQIISALVIESSFKMWILCPLDMHLHFPPTVRNLQFIYLFKPSIHIKQFDNMSHKCVKQVSQLDYNVSLQSVVS